MAELKHNFKINLDKIKGFDTAKSIKAIREEDNKRLIDYNNIIRIKNKLDVDINQRCYETTLDNMTILKGYIKDDVFIRIDKYFGFILFKLSKAALKLIGYIINNIEFNSNKIEINTTRICEELKINSRSFYSAVCELDKHDLVYRTVKQGIYSINPLHVFKGNLIIFIKMYKMKYGDEEAQLDKQKRIIIED